MFKKLLIGMYVVIVSGCAMGKFYTTDSSFNKDAAPVEAAKVTVAVLPFNISYANNENVGKFEKHFFATNLASLLSQSGYIKGAYYSPAPTPAVNYYIDGDVTLSDGENTEIKINLHTPNGTVIYTNNFGYANSPGASDSSYVYGLWYRPANKIIAEIADRVKPVIVKSSQLQPETLSNLQQILESNFFVLDMIKGYTNNPSAALWPNEKIAKVVTASSEFERNNLLAPLTTQLSKKCDEINPRYVEWQKAATRNAVLAREHDRQQSWATFFAIFSGVASALAQSQGDYANAASLQNSSDQFMQISAENGAEAQRLYGMVSEVQGVFDTNIQAEDIVLDGHAVVLKGSYQDQVDKIHSLVKQVLFDNGYKQEVKLDVATETTQTSN